MLPPASHALSWDSVFLPVRWVHGTGLGHFLGGQRLASGAGHWKRVREPPLPLEGDSLKAGRGAEVSWEGLLALVDISSRCWASLVPG